MVFCPENFFKTYNKNKNPEPLEVQFAPQKPFNLAAILSVCFFPLRSTRCKKSASGRARGSERASFKGGQRREGRDAAHRSIDSGAVEYIADRTLKVEDKNLQEPS